MFEECRRRQWRACLNAKFTNQYIKHSARKIRSRFVEYFQRFCTQRRQSNRTRLQSFLCSRPVTQTGFWNAILLWNCVTKKTYKTNLNIYIQFLNFSDAIFHRSKLCQGPNSEKVKLALSLEPYGIVWWNLPCPLILIRSSPRDCKIPLSIGRGVADVQTVKTWKLPITLEPWEIFW